MQEQIFKRLKQFQTTPFLFIGAGLSRRYLGLDGWEDLLRHFAIEAKGNEFAFEYYSNLARQQENTQGINPLIAQLIEYDFNNQWYTDAKYETQRKEYRKEVLEDKTSPFKIAIADYINSKSSLVNDLAKEIELLKQVSLRSISGVITTNYDMFLESCFENYTTYVGQEELLFSSIKGIAEIYKIHGSCNKPKSIVINEDDYREFQNKNAYLAAKLLTIFLEHPIIFIGYSLDDKNIQSILKSIIQCLSQEKLNQLSQRLFFIEWSIVPGRDEFSFYSKTFDDGKELKMTKIVLNDFSPLYEALLQNKAKYSAPLLRKLKNDIYDLVQTSEPTEKIRVVGLEDDASLDNIEVVLGVGVLSKFGIKGYESIHSNEVYEDIVFDNKNFDCDLFVKHSLERVYKQSGSSLPFYKYIRNFKGELPEIIKNAIVLNYEDILSRSLKSKKENNPYNNRTIKDLQNEYGDFKCLSQIALLDFNKIDLKELEQFLKDFMRKYPEIFKSKGIAKSDLRRLIKIYDWLKYYSK